MTTYKNVIYNCECGGRFTGAGKWQHKLTKRHRLFIGEYIESEKDRIRKEKKTNYMKLYRENNRDKVRQYLHNYYILKKSRNES